MRAEFTQFRRHAPYKDGTIFGYYALDNVSQRSIGITLSSFKIYNFKYSISVDCYENYKICPVEITAQEFWGVYDKAVEDMKNFSNLNQNKKSSYGKFIRQKIQEVRKRISSISCYFTQRNEKAARSTSF